MNKLDDKDTINHSNKNDENNFIYFYDFVKNSDSIL